MQHEPIDTNSEKIDSITEQVDLLSRLACDDSVGDTPPSDASAQPVTEECVVDFNWLINRIEDEKLVGQIMPLCVDDNRRNLEMLGEAVSNSDRENIRNYSHCIKGSAANMGAMRLAGPADRLERLALEGDLSEANDWLCQMRTEFEKLETFVANPNWMEIAKIHSS